MSENYRWSQIAHRDTVKLDGSMPRIKETPGTLIFTKDAIITDRMMKSIKSAGRHHDVKGAGLIVAFESKSNCHYIVTSTAIGWTIPESSAWDIA
jgi:hypothetical protein